MLSPRALSDPVVASNTMSRQAAAGLPLRKFVSGITVQGGQLQRKVEAAAENISG